MKTDHERQSQLKRNARRRRNKPRSAPPRRYPVRQFPEPAKPEATPAPPPQRHGLIRASAPLTVCAAVIALLIYGVTLIPQPEFTAFDINAYREKLARRPGESLRSLIARHLGADGLTPNGTAGWLDYEPSSGNLVMSIKDHHGMPVNGADVRAAIRRTDQAQGSHFIMTQDQDKRYSAELKSFGKGTWDISVTAIDPSVPRGSGLIFRVEKNVRVE